MRTRSRRLSDSQASAVAETTVAELRSSVEKDSAKSSASRPPLSFFPSPKTEKQQLPQKKTQVLRFSSKRNGLLRRSGEDASARCARGSVTKSTAAFKPGRPFSTSTQIYSNDYLDTLCANRNYCTLCPSLPSNRFNCEGSLRFHYRLRHSNELNANTTSSPASSSTIRPLGSMSVRSAEPIRPMGSMSVRSEEPMRPMGSMSVRAPEPIRPMGSMSVRAPEPPRSPSMLLGIKDHKC